MKCLFKYNFLSFQRKRTTLLGFPAFYLVGFRNAIMSRLANKDARILSFESSTWRENFDAFRDSVFQLFQLIMVKQRDIFQYLLGCLHQLQLTKVKRKNANVLLDLLPATSLFNMESNRVSKIYNKYYTMQSTRVRKFEFAKVRLRLPNTL